MNDDPPSSANDETTTGTGSKEKIKGISVYDDLLIGYREREQHSRRRFRRERRKVMKMLRRRRHPHRQKIKGNEI